METPLEVLLLEDDPTVRAIAERTLKSAPSVVTVATTVSEALALRRPFDAAVLDINLPDGDGFQVCKHLLANDNPPAVLFLTTRDAVADRVTAFAAGAVDYIIKPFSPEELIARVSVQARREVERRALARSARLAELRERARQDLADFIVHDLKTPLSSIMGTLALLKDSGGLPPEALSRFVDHSQYAARFMLLLINDLLDLSRSEDGRLPCSIAPVDLESLVSRIKGLFEVRMELNKIAFETSVVPAGAAVLSDYQLVFRSLVNLLANAVKYAGMGKTASLDVSVQDGRLRLAVADRGPGVPDSEKSRLFSRYDRLGMGDAPEAIQGSGLGLAFCKAAAATLGGRVWVEDRPGGGSVFVIDVPAETVKPA